MDMVEKVRISETGGDSRRRRDSIHGRGKVLHQERGGGWESTLLAALVVHVASAVQTTAAVERINESA